MANSVRHVAIIMDGNGRWAEAHGQDRLYGHTNGVSALRSVVSQAASSEVEYLTVYAFSTENWGRPQVEVDGLMELLASTIISEALPLASNGVRLRFIGQTDALPVVLQRNIESVSKIEIQNIRLNLVVALNYSGRSDIVMAVNRILSAGVERVSERAIAENLSTSGIPDVDLLIRTSGEQRLSNFLLWETSYSEIYFTDVLWPDFKGEEFRSALEWFAGRSRRFGKL